MKARDVALFDAFAWALGAMAVEFTVASPTSRMCLTYSAAARVPERKKLFNGICEFREADVPHRTQEDFLRYQARGTADDGEPKTFDSIAAVLLTAVAISPARSVLSGRGARKPCVITGSVRERLISGSTSPICSPLLCGSRGSGEIEQMAGARGVTSLRRPTALTMRSRDDTKSTLLG